MVDWNSLKKSTGKARRCLKAGSITPGDLNKANLHRDSAFSKHLKHESQESLEEELKEHRKRRGY